MQVLTIDLSVTRGQSSAIEANGSPIVTIRVTTPVVELEPTLAGEAQEIPGFGVVISGGPVNGYEVLYTSGSVVTTDGVDEAFRQYQEAAR